MKIPVFMITIFSFVTLFTLTSTSCRFNKNNLTKQSSETKIYVCIGTSAAGLSAAKTLKECDPSSKVICFSDEKEFPYNKCKFHKYLSKKDHRNLPNVMSAEQAVEIGIDLRLGMRVIDINPDKKYITLADGSSQSYDKLFIGTGTSPILPPIAEIDSCRNVFIYHNMHNVHAMMSYLDTVNPKHVVVIGAGLRGLEGADALQKRGFKVTIITRGEHVLGEKADIQSSTLIKKYIQASETHLQTNATIQSVHSKNGKIESIMLTNGKIVPCDMLVIAYGTTVNNQLALKAGLELSHDGIKVDEYMTTSNPDIYAGGDVAIVKDNATGGMARSSKWRDAQAQGKIAAYNMTGKTLPYNGAFGINTSSFFGVKVLTCEPVKNVPAGYTFTTRRDHGVSHTFILHDDMLKGFCLVWDAATQSRPDPFFLKSLIINKKKVDPRMLTDGKSINFGITSLPGMASEMLSH